jgi:outer membrane protein TolC
VLLRLAYLTVTNALAVLRLLPMSDGDKDAEILALRHQITILQRQLGTAKAKFAPETGLSSPRCSNHCPDRRCTGCD